MRYPAARASRALQLLMPFLLASFALCSLMAVDLGEAYIKVAVARPGKGLELVTNEQSKRKTPAVVGFTVDGERLFGDAAVAYAARAPERVIFGARRLIGACAPDDSRGAPFCRPASVTVDGIGEFTGVTAVAMLLSMARRQAETALGSVVKDVAVTVPASFDRARRAAVCDAATVAGLNCLGVVNANTAAAVKYALDGKAKGGAPTTGSSKGKHVALFYDVGASGTVATVARFHGDATVSRVEVLSHASDSALGGDALDELLVAQLADAFDAQRAGTEGARDDPRGSRDVPRVMARLRKEARRAREILSANTERMVAVPALYQDMDLRHVVTRAGLETAAKDALAAAPRPALRALQMAGVRAEELAAVVPFGGTSRMPKIQELVLGALGKAAMNKSINGDEAAVMGAVFVGASLSSTFRVRKLDVMDRFQRTVSVEVARDAGGGLLSAAKKRMPQVVVLFDREKAHMPAKKTLSVTRTADFEFKLYFDMDKTGLSSYPGRTLYAVMKVSGVAKVLDKLGKQAGAKKNSVTPTPRVAITFHLDRSGAIRVGTAESSVDETIVVEREVVVKEKKTEKKLKESPAASEAEATPAASAEGDEKKAEDKAENKTEDKKEEKKEEKKKTRIEKREQSIVHRQTLKVEVVPTADSILGAQLSESELKAGKALLQKLEDADKERAERADALNALEGFILSARSRIRGAEEGDDLYEVSTEEERSALVEKLNEAEDWMFTDAASQTGNLRSKHAEVLKAINVIDQRATERAERPKAVTAMRTEITEALTGMEVIEKLHKERKSGNDDKFAEFRKQAEDALKWLDEQVAAQEKRAPTEQALLTVKMIDDKLHVLQMAATKLAKLELPPAPPAATEEAKPDVNATADAKDATADGDSTSAKADLNVEASVKDEL